MTDKLDSVSTGVEGNDAFKAKAPSVSDAASTDHSAVEDTPTKPPKKEGDLAQTSSDTGDFLEEESQKFGFDYKTMHTKGGRVKYRMVKDYVGLFKDTFDDHIKHSTQSTDHGLDASAIGASFWTQREKRMFFLTLDGIGLKNIDLMAACIGTKSVPEVQQYLLALDEGLSDLDGELKSRGHEAAAELNTDMEQTLDELTEPLEERVHYRICEIDKTEYGERWIIDFDRAEEIEHELEVAAQLDGEQTLDQDADDEAPRRDSAPNWIYPSAKLLRPLAFIDMSYNVFMNSNEEQTTRHDQLPIQTKDAQGPSILRSAFELLHERCLAYTKRLVDGAHFQATARLRADPDPRRIAAVSRSDVQKASDILMIPRPDPIKYWVNAVKRNRPDVYSQSKRYQEGRRHQRDLGYKLEIEEVVEELSRSIPDDDAQAQDESKEELDRAEQELSIRPGSAKGLPELSHMERGDSPTPAESESDESCQSSSDESDIKLEQLLESQDRVHSRYDDNQIRGRLGLSQEQKQISPSLSPPGHLDGATHHQARRDFDAYVADWEQPDGVPANNEFTSVELGALEKRQKRVPFQDRKFASSDDDVSSSEEEAQELSRA